MNEDEPIDYTEDRADGALGPEAARLQTLVRQRRFRGLVASFGCAAFFLAWGAFAGVPVAVMAWRYWFGS